VEFAIEDYWETGLEGVVQVAKLIGSETVCEYSGLPAVESYNEIEGTIELCRDMIDKQKLKTT
jgi:hypothetical protein